MTDWGLAAIVCRSVLGALVVCSGVFAQTSPSPAGPIPAESFFRNPDLAAAKLSPSGRWLAVATGVGSARVGLVTIDLQAQGAIQQAARFGDADIRDFHWVNDDRLVFELVDLMSGSGDQAVAPGLFSVRRDGSEQRQLIAPFGRPIVGLRTGAVAAQREPLPWNHILLKVPDGGGEEVVVGELTADGRSNLRSVAALRLNVVTGRTTSLSRGAPPYAQHWLLDPKGEPRVI